MSIDITNLPRVLATSGAIGLVVASAGFGAFYAYTVGIQSGIILAGLSVLMALALEAVKPLAVSAGIQAWKHGAGPVAFGLTLLAIISVGYSLTAELSLVSQTKGDLVAERKAGSTSAKRVEDELQTIGITRPSKVIEADLIPYLSRPELKGCSKPLTNWKLQAVCADKVAPLRAELALAERREALEAKDTGTPIKEADPGAKALAAMLTAIGLPTNSDTVALWLLLIPVLALEFGSAFAHVLVQAFPASPGTVKDIGLSPVAQPVVQPENAEDVAVRERVKAAVVDHLKTNGGSVSSGERGLAKLIGSSRGTMRRAVNGLVLAGIVVAEATRNGTVLRLAA